MSSKKSARRLFAFLLLDRDDVAESLCDCLQYDFNCFRRTIVACWRRVSEGDVGQGHEALA